MMTEPEGGFFDDPDPFDSGCKEAVAEERDRIIKLLEGFFQQDRIGANYCYECGDWDELQPDLTALIKGETE